MTALVTLAAIDKTSLETWLNTTLETTLDLTWTNGESAQAVIEDTVCDIFHDADWCNIAFNGPNEIKLKGTLEAAVLAPGTTKQVYASTRDADLTWPGITDGPALAKPYTPSHGFSGVVIEPGPEVEVIDPITLYPEWAQPLGAHDAYPEGSIVVHGEKLWITTTAPNVWEPGVSGWREVVEAGYPAWIQPTGAHDAYAADTRVTHNGRIWLNIHGDGNVWEPGVFGWADEGPAP